MELLEASRFSWDFEHEPWVLLDSHVFGVATAVGEMRTWGYLVAILAYLPAAVGVAFVVGIESVVTHGQMQRTWRQRGSLGVVAALYECLLVELLVPDVVVDERDGTLISDSLIALDIIVAAVGNVESGSQLGVEALDSVDVVGQVMTFEDGTRSCRAGNGQLESELGLDR